MSTHYKGSRSSQEFADLWLMSEVLDAKLDEAYRASGVNGVNWVLHNDDLAEHVMARLGAQIAYLRSGDRRLYEAIVTAKPPGESDILPAWCLSEARDHSTALWKQEGRVAGPPAKASQPRVPQPPVPPDAEPIAPGPKARVRKRGKFADGGPGAPKAPAAPPR